MRHCCLAAVLAGIAIASGSPAWADAERSDAGRDGAADGTGRHRYHPKGVPHSWSEITTDTISYLIFRTDPEKVMELK